MKISYVEILFIVITLSLSLILSEEFFSRQRTSRLPKRPPMQFQTINIRTIPAKSSLKKPIDQLNEVLKPKSKKESISRSKPLHKPKVKNRQLQLVARPRPIGFPYRLSIAFLIPAIPLLIGTTKRGK